jgi:hypothetical protein
MRISRGGRDRARPAMSGYPARDALHALLAEASQSGTKPIAPARVARAAPAALVPTAILVATKTRQRIRVAIPASGSQSGSSVMAQTQRRMAQTRAMGTASFGRRPGGCSECRRHGKYAGKSASHDGPPSDHTENERAHRLAAPAATGFAVSACARHGSCPGADELHRRRPPRPQNPPAATAAMMSMSWTGLAALLVPLKGGPAVGPRRVNSLSSSETRGHQIGSCDAGRYRMGTGPIEAKSAALQATKAPN